MLRLLFAHGASRHCTDGSCSARAGRHWFSWLSLSSFVYARSKQCTVVWNSSLLISLIRALLMAGKRCAPIVNAVTSAINLSSTSITMMSCRDSAGGDSPLTTSCRSKWAQANSLCCAGRHGDRGRGVSSDAHCFCAGRCLLLAMLLALLQSLRLGIRDILCSSRASAVKHAVDTYCAHNRWTRMNLSLRRV